jgi:uncharacterized protein YbjT (DUF2867 family)
VPTSSARSKFARLPPAVPARCSCPQAASAAGVQQFVLVTSLGTGKIGWPAGVLNLFGGVLIFKRKAEEALEASGLPYVIVRPGAPPVGWAAWRVAEGLLAGIAVGVQGCGTVASPCPALAAACATDRDLITHRLLFFSLCLFWCRLVRRRHGAPPG